MAPPRSPYRLLRNELVVQLDQLDGLVLQRLDAPVQRVNVGDAACAQLLPGRRQQHLGSPHLDTGRATWPVQAGRRTLSRRAVMAASMASVGVPHGPIYKLGRPGCRPQRVSTAWRRATRLAMLLRRPASTSLCTPASCTGLGVGVRLTSARYVMGLEAMLKMASSDVLILGLGGLGVEIGSHTGDWGPEA